MVKAYCSFRQVPSAAKSLSLFAGFTLFNRIGKSGAEIFSPTPLYCFFYFCVLLFLYLHRLVGLRLLRLCLKLRQGFALYPQWVSPLDPDQGRVPGPFARFARCFILLYACNLLWSAMLIPHSSFLIPHSSFNSAPHLPSPLIYSNVIVLYLLH